MKNGMRRDTKLCCEPYLDFIRSKPCVVCGKQGVDAHHIVAQGQRQSKRNDFTALPFCRKHHNEYHNGQEYFDVDGRHVEIDLWRECFWNLVEFVTELDGDVVPHIERGKI